MIGALAGIAQEIGIVRHNYMSFTPDKVKVVRIVEGT